MEVILFILFIVDIFVFIGILVGVFIGILDALVNNVKSYQDNIECQLKLLNDKEEEIVRLKRILRSYNRRRYYS